MTKYTQTAADLDGCNQASPETYTEQVAALGLAFFVACGIAAALIHWWSN